MRAASRRTARLRATKPPAPRPATANGAIQAQLTVAAASAGAERAAAGDHLLQPALGVELEVERQ